MKQKTKDGLIEIIGIALLITVISLTIIAATGIYTQDSKKDISCYELHKQECYDCHNKNLTYALCSGFCFEAREMDLDIYCAFHPLENCEDITKECLFD